jgi:hypothetical protein
VVYYKCGFDCGLSVFLSENAESEGTENDKGCFILMPSELTKEHWCWHGVAMLSQLDKLGAVLPF